MYIYYIYIYVLPYMQLISQIIRPHFLSWVFGVPTKHR